MGEPDVKPTLLYIYGPPTSGKLTVATALAEVTGFSLFHNHLSVDAVRCALPFGSKPFTEVLHRLRLDVFQTAARAGISLIFTNNSAWSGPDARGGSGIAGNRRQAIRNVSLATSSAVPWSACCRE
jgi:hypothetical protein